MDSRLKYRASYAQGYGEQCRKCYSTIEGDGLILAAMIQVYDFQTIAICFKFLFPVVSYRRLQRTR